MRTSVAGEFFPIPDFDVERYLCGELGDNELERFRGELARRPELQAYIANRQHSRAEFLARQPLRLPPIAAVRPARTRHVFAALAAGGLAIAAGVLLAQREHLAGPGTEPPATRDTVRVKGSALSAELYVKRGDDVFRYSDGTALRPQDLVRATIEHPHAGYFTLLSRDPSGRIEVYYDHIATSAGRYMLPDSLSLDAASGDERWLLIWANTAEPAARYIERWQSGRALETAHTWITIHKEHP